MGQTINKESVTLTSHKKAQEPTSNGKENQHDETVNQSDEPSTPQKTKESSLKELNNNDQNMHANNLVPVADDPAVQKVTFTLENGEKKSEMEDHDGPTAEKTNVSKKRKSFYETVDASEVLPHLIIGNNASSTNRDFLARKNIRFILSLTSEPIESQVEGIEYETVIMEDDEEEMLQPHFETCFKFIDKAKGSASPKNNKKSKRRKSVSEENGGVVLVHSFFGISRAAAVILAYLMKDESWTLKEAYTHLKEKHPSINPNDNFIVQLLHYEQELHEGKMSMTLKDFYH